MYTVCMIGWITCTKQVVLGDQWGEKLSYKYFH